MRITYRPLQAADMAEVQAVALAAWRWTYRCIFAAAFIDQFVQTNYANERLQTTVADVERGQSFFEVALDGSRIIGFCHIGRNPGSAQLFRIYLLPTYVGHRFGQTLLRRGEAWLQDQGIGEYGCYVHKANEIGKRFYARQQFEHLSEHDRDDELYMHKTLDKGINPD